MRIAVMAPQYPPDLLSDHQDGVATYFQQMVAGYRSTGAEVVVLTTGRECQEDEQGTCGEKIIRLRPPSPAQASVARALQILTDESRLMRLYLREHLSHPIDLLELPDWLTPALVPVTARRIFMKLHGPAEFIRHLNGQEPNRGQRILDARTRFWASRSDALHAGAFVLSEYARTEWELNRDVPVALDPWRAPDTPPDLGPSKVSFDADRIEILSIGRLEWRKGQHVILQALAQLPADLLERDWRLTLIGRDTATGPSGTSYRAYCHSLMNDWTKNRTRWITGVAPSELPAIHAAADVTVVASLDGNYGYTTIQALCDGACLVTTLEPGTTESPYVVDSVNGFLTSPGDQGDLARVLTRLLTDADLRNRIRGEARKVALQVDPQRIAERVLVDAGL